MTLQRAIDVYFDYTLTCIQRYPKYPDLYFTKKTLNHTFPTNLTSLMVPHKLKVHKFAIDQPLLLVQ